MTLEQAQAWRPSAFFTGHLVDHPPLRSRAQVLFDRRVAQLQLLHAVASHDRSVEIEPGPQEAR